jgi:hypothetical protein
MTKMTATCIVTEHRPKIESSVPILCLIPPHVSTPDTIQDQTGMGGFSDSRNVWTSSKISSFSLFLYLLNLQVFLPSRSFFPSPCFYFPCSLNFSPFPRRFTFTPKILIVNANTYKHLPSCVTGVSGLNCEY